MIVVDTNIIAYFFITGKYTQEIRDVYIKNKHWIAPILWRSEFRNLLLLHVKHEKMTFEKAYQLYLYAEKLFAGKEYSSHTNQILNLALQSDCSSYDCEFISLAIDRQTILVTHDKKLLKSFPDIAISPAKYLEKSEI